MKCVIINVFCLGAVLSLTQGMTIHLLDVAAQQSSIEDGSLLTRIFFTKNITGRTELYNRIIQQNYTTELDDTEMKPTQKDMFSSHKNSSEAANTGNDKEMFDSWSIVWYIASFSGLILFFLIVSCSEWCCRNRIRRQQQQQQQQPQNQTTSTTSQTDMRVIATRSQPEQQPPPSYDQFAPPNYDSLITGGETKKSEYEVYVVPVHTMTTMLAEQEVSSVPPLAPGAEEAPPSYAVLNMQPSVAEQGNSARAPRC